MGLFKTDGERSKDFMLRVEREFEIGRESSQEAPITPYDTFDWRLYRNSYLAYSTPGSFVVRECLSRPPLTEYKTEVVPRFFWEFEDEKLRELLRKIAGIRALLPLTTMKVREKKYHVRNEDEKIVGRFSLLAYAADDIESRSYLLIKPLKGYAEEGDLLRSAARESAMEELSMTLLEELLRVRGINPGDYTSKLDVKLNKAQNVTEAALVIHRHLLSTIRANIPGIIQDYDTEFLHDFRVATRRTRACLSQVKEALPREAASNYNAEFKKIAQRCNELRDLDVYLLERQRYYDMLPQHLHKGLDQYFVYIKRRRGNQHKKFSSFLGTESFRSVLEGWEGFLENTPTNTNSTPAIEVAKLRISGRFNKIIKKGSKITDASPDEDLHSLRIECKKLRYLLEFFRTLFPEKKMDKLIKQLKGFQDNLGEFNDLTMQQQNLSAYLERSGGSAQRKQLMTAAIGGLLTALNSRQKEVRGEFYLRFTEFDSKQVHWLCEELFGRG